MKKKVLIGYVIAAVVALLALEYAFWTKVSGIWNITVREAI